VLPDYFPGSIFFIPVKEAVTTIRPDIQPLTLRIMIIITDPIGFKRQPDLSEVVDLAVLNTDAFPASYP